MNVDIQTEHVAIRPAWHDMIVAWLDRCRRLHPDVVDVDLRLRHGESGPEAVDVVAVARGRNLRIAERATDMDAALYGALDAIERELALNEAIRPRG